MKNFIRNSAILLFIITLSVLSITNPAHSQTLEEVSCFAEGLYEFQSIDVTAAPSGQYMNQSFSAGENIEFEGYIENNNDYPVVDAYLYARVSSYNEEYLTEGFNIIDELMVLESVSLVENSKTPINFNWRSPENLPADDYRIDFFVTVDKNYNLGGLPFSNEIIAGFTEFNIGGQNEKSFYLDRTDTLFNGEKFMHIGSWPFTPSQGNLNIQQPIENLTNNPIDVVVSYDFYYWDSIKEENLIDSRQETITIDPQSKELLTYSSEGINTSVGFLKITAESDGLKSIVNVRFVTELNDSRINYAALTSFPIEKGQEYKVFTCAYNTMSQSEGNIVRLSLKDKDGNVIAEDQIQANLRPDMSGFGMNLISDTNYKYLVLETSVEDSQGNVLVSYSNVYDCASINSERCMYQIREEYDKNILLYSVIALLLLIIIIYFIKSRKNKDKMIVSTLTIMFLIIGSILVTNIVNRSEIAIAQHAVSGTTQSVTRSNSNNNVGWDNRLLSTISIHRGLVGKLLSDDEDFDPGNANIGDEFFVEVTSTCTFLGSGGAWNTPNCGIVQEIIDSKGHREGRLFMTQFPLVAGIDYDDQKLSCSYQGSMSSSQKKVWKCSIIDDGNIQISTSIDPGTSTLHACASTADVGNRLTKTNPDNSNPNCREGWGDGGPNPERIGFDNDPNKTTLSLLGATFNWNLNVQPEDDPEGEDPGPGPGPDPDPENGSVGEPKLLSLSCAFMSSGTTTGEYAIDQDIVAIAIPNTEDITNHNLVKYRWVGTFNPTSGDEQEFIVNTDSTPQLSMSFDQHGIFNLGVTATYEGQSKIANCVIEGIEENAIVSSPPSVTFVIPTSLTSNETCSAFWSLTNDENTRSTCNIVTEFGEIAKLLGVGLIGDSITRIEEVDHGNSYRVECTTEGGEEFNSGELLRCINPDLLER